MAYTYGDAIRKNYSKVTGDKAVRGIDYTKGMDKGGMFSDMSMENAIGLANLGVDSFTAWNMDKIGNKQIDLANKEFNYSKMLGEANYANNAQLTMSR